MSAPQWLKLALFLVCLGLQWKQAYSQCSGTPSYLIANSTYQIITSPNYPNNYPTNQDCMWVIQADNVTDAIRIEILDTVIEYHRDCAYDSVELFDGNNSTNTSLSKFCGTSTPSVVSGGNYLTVTFKSDYSLGSRGFKGQYKSGDRDSLLDDVEDAATISFWILAAAVAGGALLFFGIGVVIYACHKAKKAKRSRQVIAWGPHDMLPAYDMDYHRPPAPPGYDSYFAGGGGPFSPPPGYCEEDPNPQALPYLSAMRQMQNNRLQNTDTRLHDSSSRMQNTSSRMQNTSTPSNRLSNTANTRETVGHDTNANTHFVVPGNVRGMTSLTQQAPVNDTSGLSRAPSVIQTPRPQDQQPDTTRGQANEADTGEIPGQPVDSSSTTATLPTGNTASQRPGSSMSGSVTNEGTRPIGNTAGSNAGNRSVVGSLQANKNPLPVTPKIVTTNRSVTGNNQVGNKPGTGTTNAAGSANSIDGGGNRSANNHSGTGNISANNMAGPRNGPTNNVAGPRNGPTNNVAGPRNGQTNNVAGPRNGPTNNVAGPRNGQTNNVAGPRNGPTNNVAGPRNGPTNNVAGPRTVLANNVAGNRNVPANGAPVIQAPANNPTLDRQISDVSDVSLPASLCNEEAPAGGPGMNR